MLIEIMTQIIFMLNQPKKYCFLLIKHENFLTVVKNLKSEIENQLSWSES